MGSMIVSSCRWCMRVSCVHPVAVLNAAFCMTCSLLMLGEDARGDHIEEAYSRAGVAAWIIPRGIKQAGPKYTPLAQIIPPWQNYTHVHLMKF